MRRLPAIAIGLVLSGFVIMFLDLGLTAPASVGFAGPAVCFLFAAAISCFVVLAAWSAITGEFPL